MTRSQPGFGRRGLTLIELVLTLTILAISGALVSGALSGALRAWNSGLRSGREELVARIVLERLSAQLRAAVSSPARRGEEEVVAFDAAGDRVRFVTPSAGAAPTQVFYGLEGSGEERCLVYREYPWPDKDFFGESRARSEERVPEVTDFSVRVERRQEQDAGEPSLAGEWSPADKILPGRVTVELQLRSEGRPEPLRYRIEVPVLTRSTP